MKTRIYIIFLVTLFLLTLILMFLYYTQDFTEELTIADSVNFNDISFEMTIGNNSYLKYAEAKIGNLKLENNGYFTQKYFFPNLIGCMAIPDNPNNLYSNIIMEFYVGPKTGTKHISRYLSSKEKEFTVSVGNVREIEIYGAYIYSYNTKTSSFAKENLGTIKVFEISKKEANPFLDIYDSYSSNRPSCEFLTNNKSPIKTIYIQ